MFFSERIKDLNSRYALMSGKDKVRPGIPERKSKTFQLLLRPLSRLNHLCNNVLIVQTYSKSRALAGMRIGYAMGNPELIKAMNDVRYSYNSYPMTRLSVALGVAALEVET